MASEIPRSSARRPTVALLPWGDVFHDFLDRLGVSFEQLRDEFTGSWMFGYAAALATAGVRTVVVCPTSRVRERVEAVHGPTGAGLVLLPTPRAHAFLRSHALHGRLDGRREPRMLARAAAAHVAPYLGTPPVALARLLGREDCDALLCQEYEDPRFDVCAVVGKTTGVPVFATFQGADYRLSKLESALRPLAIRACAGLVVGARGELERVRRAYRLPESKLARIVNPIDVAAWTPTARDAARRELDIPADAVLVAWHGQVQLWRKGLDVLLEAWRDVTEARPDGDLRLVLVGGGEDVAEVRRRIEALELRGVRLLAEWVRDRDRLRGILSAADVYAFPSRHEGLPVSPVEAMACGLPVVGADASGVADVVGDTGVVVPTGDVRALARALADLLDDEPRRRELGRRARERVKDLFSLEAVGAQLREFLLDGRAP